MIDGNRAQPGRVDPPTRGQSRGIGVVGQAVDPYVRRELCQQVSVDPVSYRRPLRHMPDDDLLQTAIQSVMDCSRLLVMLLGWRRLRDEEDALLILPRHDLLPKELTERLLNAKKFRNVLVHQYTEVDPQQVFRHLKDDCGDLDAFVRAFESYLRQHTV